MSNKDRSKAGGVPADVSRRQILKGLAAVPAIATLGAASQAAAASITACEMNSAGGAPLPGATGDIEAIDSGAVTYNCEANGVSIPDTREGTIDNIADPIVSPGSEVTTSEVYGMDGEAALADSSANGRCVVYAKLDSAGTGFDLTFDANEPGVTAVAASCLVSIGIINRLG